MRLSKWFSAVLLAMAFFANTAFADYPSRGMSMNGVRAQYGEPQSVRQSADPVKSAGLGLRYGNMARSRCISSGIRCCIRSCIEREASGGLNQQ